MATGSRGRQEWGRATAAGRRGAHLAAPMGRVEREAAVDATSTAHQPHATDAGVGQPGEVDYDTRAGRGSKSARVPGRGARSARSRPWSLTAPSG